MLKFVIYKGAIKCHRWANIQNAWSVLFTIVLQDWCGHALSPSLSPIYISTLNKPAAASITRFHSLDNKRNWPIARQKCEKSNDLSALTAQKGVDCHWSALVARAAKENKCKAIARGCAAKRRE